MIHQIHEVTGFRKVKSRTLRVDFSDGTSRVIDFSRILRGEVYGPLEDDSLFDQVEVDPEVCTLVWPNGADFDPAILHDWPDHEETWSG